MVVKYQGHFHWSFSIIHRSVTWNCLIDLVIVSLRKINEHLSIKFYHPLYSFTHDHDHESVGVAQPQPRLDSQLNHHHSDGAESNTTNHDIMITSRPLPLTLSTNDSVAATSNSIGTSPSQQESTFDSGEYEADLILSAALVGDKHVPWCATTEPDLEPEPPVQADSADQNINERYNSY